MSTATRTRAVDIDLSKVDPATLARAELSPRQLAIFVGRFRHDPPMSLRQLADAFHVSRNMIWLDEAAMLKKLNQALACAA